MHIVYEGDSVHEAGTQALRHLVSYNANVTVTSGGIRVEGAIVEATTDRAGYVAVRVRPRLDEGWNNFGAAIEVSSLGDEDFTVRLH